MNPLLRRFAADRGGNTSVQTAMLFGAVAVALAVLVAPLLHSAANQIADTRALGIDRVITGSIEKNSYRVNRSVLSEKPVTICGGRISEHCNAQ